MKRLLKSRPTIEFEINIDILSSSFSSVMSSQNVDLSDTEYEAFKDSLIAQFLQKQYHKLSDDIYTHSSNIPGSYSDYITFTKLLDSVCIVVVVNLRLSDHSTRPNVKNGEEVKTGAAKRQEYAARIGSEISNDMSGKLGHQVDAVPFPIDIIFNDEISETGQIKRKHFNSYFAAELYINTELRNIQRAIDSYLSDRES